MRQHNNNNKNRMRGRGRKQGNSLNRNFESNGPDVKIRGNAGHIAEKYQNLARDALSNGDTVMAENYYQHAEHYSRIVAAAQQNNQQSGQRNEDGQNLNGRAPQPDSEGATTEASTGEEANQQNNSEANEQSVEERPKRSRPRARKESKPEASEASTDSAEVEVSESSNENSLETAPKPKTRTRRPRAKKSEVITEDAAALPDSITAAPVVEAEVPATIEE